jgi:hypothetical protein
VLAHHAVAVYLASGVAAAAVGAFRVAGDGVHLLLPTGSVRASRALLPVGLAQSSVVGSVVSLRPEP